MHQTDQIIICSVVQVAAVFVGFYLMRRNLDRAISRHFGRQIEESCREAAERRRELE